MRCFINFVKNYLLENTPAFLVYNASAGSGKTFTLVKEYLKKILLSSKPDYYTSLLAITFTNKAVAEMKQRIIGHLQEFSKIKTLRTNSPLLKQLSEECDLSPEIICKKSGEILKHMLHHYSGFSVETIDGFNHRLIRTFARDLKIASNFEVILDEKQLLQQAVDQLLSRAGEDDAITDLLVDFTLSKTDDDRSWDISRDITDVSVILFNENDRKYVSLLKEKSLQDFALLISRLKTECETISKKIDKIASAALELIEESGLQHDDFDRGSFPNYLQNLLAGKKDRYEAQWQQTMLEKPLYPKRVLKENPHAAKTIDELASVFATAFQESKALVFEIRLRENILKNLTPLSVINLVRREIDIIKDEETILPISEFNAIINSEIKHQPAPFIYERLGERYRHFFIDEFQDTSLLQWENLIPLIDNALSQEFAAGDHGSLMVVGDAKQSIYRWRGGLPEQFIDLYNCKDPFSVSEKRVENLETNFRSCKTIIDFNNSFFQHIANFFDSSIHAELYSLGNQQNSTDKDGGYVFIEFVAAESQEELDEQYAVKVRSKIVEAQDQGFSLDEICILTRTKKDGVKLGVFLMESDIPVVSSETLLLQHSPAVLFLVDGMRLREDPDNDEVKASMLLFLHSHLDISEDIDGFMYSFFSADNLDFDTALSSYNISFDMDKVSRVSVYESCEYLLKVFKLESKADAYIYGFMNLVHDYQYHYAASQISFIDYWENKRDGAAISTSDSMKAVRLMTIHKAKGLEFPVVLVPYADVDIFKEQGAKAWYASEGISDDFETFFINYSQEVADYGPFGKLLYDERRSRLQLDNLNLLYVSFTRPIEQLYVFSKLSTKPKNDNPQNYSQFLRSYLSSIRLWEDDKLIYKFGKTERMLKVPEKAISKEICPEYFTTLPEEHDLHIASREASLWHTRAQEAIETGTQIHELMAGIRDKDDLESVITTYRQNANISEEALIHVEKMLENIITHPMLSTLFSGHQKVENERDIVTKNGELLRPDRINFNDDGSVTIVDYKTGTPKSEHREQLMGYAAAIREMGYPIKELLILYVSGETVLINKL